MTALTEIPVLWDFINKYSSFDFNTALFPLSFHLPLDFILFCYVIKYFVIAWKHVDMTSQLRLLFPSRPIPSNFEIFFAISQYTWRSKLMLAKARVEKYEVNFRSAKLYPFFILL